jgi:hypothetical protein
MTNLHPIALYASQKVVSDAAVGADVRGVYGVFFKRTERVLERCGYLDFDQRMPVEAHEGQLLYVGASLDPLRRRVLAHLSGSSQGSSLRMTLGALFAEDLGLDPISDGRRNYYHFGSGEGRLTEWIVENSSVGFYASDDPYGIERQILTDVAVPLNIEYRKRHPFSRYLMGLRAMICSRPSRSPSAVKLSSLRHATPSTVSSINV